MQTTQTQIPHCYMNYLVKTYPNVWELQDPNTQKAHVNYQYALNGVVNTAYACKVFTDSGYSHLYRDLEKHACQNKTFRDFSEQTEDQTILAMAEVALQNPALDFHPMDSKWRYRVQLPPRGNY